MSANYKLVGKRWLRKYSSNPTPVYAAESEVSKLSGSLCSVPWSRVSVRDSQMTYHTDGIVFYEDPDEKTGGVTGLDYNVIIRDRFDAALFCGGHVSETHVVYGNAACYKFRLPDMQSYPLLERLKVDVTSDPYNSSGARIAIFTNSTGVIPTECASCRQGSSPSQSHSCTKTQGANAWTTNDTYADAVAPRESRQVTTGGKTSTNWYPVNGTCEFVLSSPLQLQKYLYVFVLLENYNTVRGNWVEGCSYIANSVAIQTSGSVAGWTDGGTIDLSEDSISDSELGSSSVVIVKDGVVPDVSGSSGSVASVAVLASGTAPRTVEGNLVSRISQITDELSPKNMFSGLATAVGMIEDGKMSVAAVESSSPSYQSYGAGYCYRSSSDLKFVDSDGNEANPKTLCVSAASLMVPFGISGGVEMKYAKFDWSKWMSSSDAPSGSVLNFWMREGKFSDSLPDLSDPGLYDVTDRKIGDWTLLASASVSDGSVVVDIPQSVGSTAKGKNTILVTAFVPPSSVNAEYAEDFSRGIGSFWYNSVSPDGSLSIDFTLYPAFSPSNSYSKNSLVSYGSNLLKEWVVSSGTSGIGFFYAHRSPEGRMSAFGKSGIRYSGDGSSWKPSNVTSSADPLCVYDRSGVTIAALRSSVISTGASLPDDGSVWDTVFTPPTPILCADEGVIGTQSGAYVASTSPHLSESWVSAGLPPVSVYGVCGSVYATDKGIYVGTSPSDIPSSGLTTVVGCDGSGAARLMTDSGLFMKRSSVWKYGSLRGRVADVCTSSTPWVASADGFLWTSKDSGSTWEKTSVSGDYRGISHNGGIWIAVGDGVMSWSNDGYAWTAVTGMTGTCYKAVYSDPYWVAGFADCAMLSTDGKNWTRYDNSSGTVLGQAYPRSTSGTRGMYVTDQGAYQRMGVVYGDNGMFRTILDDPSGSFYSHPCMFRRYMSNNCWGELSYMSGIRINDCCKMTAAGDDSHIIAAGTEGLIVIDVSEDGYLNDGWKGVKESVSMGEVVQVVPGASSPSTYMLALSSSGVVYRYGTDILTQSVSPRREVAGTGEYVFRAVNGRWMNAGVTYATETSDESMVVSEHFGDFSVGNIIYGLYSVSNSSFPEDSNGYSLVYDSDGTVHRFKIVKTESQNDTPDSFDIVFAEGDTWEATDFDKTYNSYYEHGGMYTPAQACWTSKPSIFGANKSFQFRQILALNDTDHKYYKSYFQAKFTYRLSPDNVSGAYSVTTPDGDTVTVTLNRSTHVLTVSDGASWRDVNTVRGAGYASLPFVDRILSDSTGDYAFCGRKVFKAASLGLNWSQVDTLVDHVPFVDVVSNGSRMLSLDSDGRAFVSADSGSSWVEVFAGFEISRIFSSNGMFFASGSGRSSASSDGTSWTEIGGVVGEVYVVAFGRTYAAASSSGVYRSVDGFSWTKTSDRTDVRSLEYDGSKWMAASDSGVLMSGDDPMFTSRSIPSAPVSGFSKVYSYPGKDIVIGCSSDLSGLWFSTDGGSSWSPSDVRYGLFQDVVSDGSAYVAVGNSGVFSSSNGTHWTKVSGIDGSFYRVAYGAGKFVTVGTSGLYYSSDGSSWSTPFVAFSCVAHGAETSDGTFRWAASAPDGVYYSNGGTDWSKASGPSGSFTRIARTRDKNRHMSTSGAYLVAYSDTEAWYASDTDVSSWTKLSGLESGTYSRIEKTSSGWVAAKGSDVWFSSSGTSWTKASQAGVGTISDVWWKYGMTIVSGSSGAAWSSDGGSTWTAFSGIGSVSEIIPGATNESVPSQMTCVLYLESGEAYAVNLIGTGGVPVATKVVVAGGVDVFIAVVAGELEEGDVGHYHFQTSDFTDYSIFTSYSFPSVTQSSYKAHSGLGSRITGFSGASGRFVASTENGIYASNNRLTGYTWSQVSTSSAAVIDVAIGTNGYAVESSARMYVSSNPLTWSLYSNGLSPSSLFAVAYTGSVWVASGGKTMKSSNGVSWSETSAGIVGATAVGGRSSDVLVSSESGYAYSSDSGSTWTSGSAVKNVNWFKYIGGKWYACSADGLFVSSDMVTWAAAISSSVVLDVASYGGKWIAVGYVSSAPYVWASLDGSSWVSFPVSRTAPMYGSRIYSVVMGDGFNIVSGTAGTYSASIQTTDIGVSSASFPISEASSTGSPVTSVGSGTVITASVSDQSVSQWPIGKVVWLKNVSGTSGASAIPMIVSGVSSGNVMLEARAAITLSDVGITDTVTGDEGSYVHTISVDGTTIVVPSAAFSLVVHGSLPVINSIRDCGGYLVACTNQGVFYSGNLGSTWIPTNLHSGEFYGSAYRKVRVFGDQEQVVVVGSIGAFVAIWTADGVDFTFSRVSDDSGFMGFGFTDAVRGESDRFVVSSGNGIFGCASATMDGWYRIASGEFKTALADGATIVIGGPSGIKCSTDGGATWSSATVGGSPISTDHSNISRVGHVWIASSGSSGVSSRLANEAKIYYSVNGVEWFESEIDFGDVSTAYSFMVYGTNTVTDGTRLYTGLSFYGYTSFGNSADGVYCSDDFGRTWVRLVGISGLHVSSVGYDHVTGIVYAVAGSRGTSGLGVYFSRDEGRSWNRVGSSGDAVYGSSFSRIANALGKTWMFMSTLVSSDNLSVSVDETGVVKDIGVYRAKSDLEPSEFDPSSWDNVENPIRKRMHGGNSLCIPDIILYS